MEGLYFFIYFEASGQMATPVSRSHCLSSHISILAYPSSVRNIKTPPFPPAHPQIYLPFPSLSRLKRMGAGLVMFTIHSDTSMKSAGGPGSAWSRRLRCLLTIYSSPGAPAYHIGLELLWEAGSSGWILPNFISWPNHDGQWCSQTWAGIRSLSPVGTDDSWSFITIRQNFELWSSLHGHNSNPPHITLFQKWPHSPLLSCGRISPGPNADLFYDEARCIQVQSSDVVAVIVWLIPIFAYNEGSDVKNGEAKDWELD